MAVARPSWRLVGAALHATRALRPGEEIYLDYGETYAGVRARRGYTAGEPASPLRRKDIPCEETPAAQLGDRVPRDALFSA